MSSKWPNLLGLVNPPLDNIASLQSQLGNLPGWAIFGRSMAHDRVVFGGDDYRFYTQAGMGAICCLEWDAEGGETLPPSDLYPKFADQCREYAKASHGCHVWIIGDAMNCASQWPRDPEATAAADSHEGPFDVVAPPDRRQRHAVLFPQESPSLPEHRLPIRPADYADCYRQVREAIKSTPGHQHDLVLVGAVAPWNDDAKDVTIPSGDWVLYFEAIATALQPGECDGFAMQTATAGADPALLMSTETLAFPFSGRQAGFPCYQDFIAVIPEHHSLLPVFLTAVSQLQPWNDSNDGWIMLACEQILDYNRTQDFSPIRCLALYQWEDDSAWSIRDKAHLLEDMKSSLALLERQGIQDALVPVAWEQVNLPAHIPPGEMFTTRLQFTNIGEQPMLCSGDDPVRLGYRFLPLPGNGSRMPAHGEMRVPLPGDIGIGESDSLEARLRAPDTEGTYLLHLGFVKAQFVWSTASRHMAHRLELHVAAEAEATASEEGTPDEIPEPTAADPEPENLAMPEPEAEAEAVADPAQESEEDPVGEAEEDPVGEAAMPVESAEDETVAPEIYDISVFLPASRADQPLRPLDTLHRIIIVETGVSATLPLDAMQAHFGEFGASQIPFHFMIDRSGAVYRLQDPQRHPDPYRRNMDLALVIGLEGQAQDQDEARTKLWEAASSCAQILRTCMAAGLPHTLEVGTDTLDLQPGFSQFVQDDLAELCQHLAKLCRPLASPDQVMELAPVVLPPEEVDAPPAPDTDQEDDAVPQEDPAPVASPASADVPLPAEEEEEEVPQVAAARPEEPETSPLVPELIQEPLDLTTADRENLGYAHGGRAGVTLWATNEPGNMPLQQIRRIHALRLQDILYHYVIAPQGQIYETRRSDRADHHTSRQNAETLHIGLQGEWRQAGPTRQQTEACVHLLARLARNTQLLALEHCLLPAASTPLRIGTEDWPSGHGWLQHVVQEALAYRAAPHPAAASEDTVRPLEPEVSPAPVLPPPPHMPEAVPTPAPEPLIQAPAQVPQIVNKVGHLARHPQLEFPVRALEAVRTICVHHSNAPKAIGSEQLAESWLLDQLSSESPQPGLPYHFFIQPDGTIDQCNDVVHVCRSVAQGNESIIAVCLAGKFTAPLLPTPDQLEQAGILIAWLMQKYFVSLDEVVGHRDIDSSESLCPGEDWNTGIHWRKTLMSYVNRHLHPETLTW